MPLPLLLSPVSQSFSSLLGARKFLQNFQKSILLRRKRLLLSLVVLPPKRNQVKKRNLPLLSLVVLPPKRNQSLVVLPPKRNQVKKRNMKLLIGSLIQVIHLPIKKRRRSGKNWVCQILRWLFLRLRWLFLRLP